MMSGCEGASVAEDEWFSLRGAISAYLVAFFNLSLAIGTEEFLIEYGFFWLELFADFFHGW